MTETILTGVFALIFGFFVTMFILKNKKLFNFDEKVKEAAGLISKSTTEAENLLREAKEQAERAKQSTEEEIKLRQGRLKKIEQSLSQKGDILKKKEDRIKEEKLLIASLKEETQSKEQSIKRNEKTITEKLAQKTGLNPEEIKADLLTRNQKELEEERIDRVGHIEEYIKENAVKTAKNLLVNIIQRLCSPTSVESKAILITVPKDHIKGKIVGREGKNIEEFEKLLEVDIIFNDLPNTISVSGFNLVNRRIAERAINKLIKVKGDINPEVIKKAITEATREIDEELYALGKTAVEKIGLKITDKELIRTIGRLHFRTSYGQNIMKHSMEVSWVATMLGSELGLNVQTCRVAGFLHDLGKAIDQNPDVQGAHDFLTKELMEKYHFAPEEIHAAWTHHDSEKPATPEALIIKAADAVSAGRPGARQESLDKYIERIQKLEETARSFEGVKTSFAMSAGREVRIIVDPEKILDSSMQPLAKNVATKIEKSLSYPGKIKVNVIRRTTHIEVAR